MPNGGGAWLLALLAVAAFEACGRSDGSVAPEKTATPEGTDDTEPSGVATRFVGSEWKLSRLHGQEPLNGTNITLEVDREDGGVLVGGSATCNSYGFRNVTMKDGVLEISGGDLSTIGCSEDQVRQETAYLDALDNAATYRLRGDVLEVQNPEETTTLVFEQESLARSNPADLAGTRWLLRSAYGKPLPDDFPATVSFDSEKEVSGYDGCRHFTGRYFATENDLAVPDFGYEAEYDCLKPGAYGRIEPAPVLEGIPLDGNYALSEDRLEIRSDSGDTSVYEPLREGANVEEPDSAWVLEKFVDGNRVTPVLDGTEITLRFDGGTLRRTGTISGSAGCNTYSADYEFINEFTSGTPAVTSVTEKACSVPAGVMAQEQRYLSRLEDDTYWPSVVRSGDLELSARDNKRRMVFAALQQ
jgi:heat shock protein HslJ